MPKLGLSHSQILGRPCVRRIDALCVFKGFYRLLGLTAKKVRVAQVVMQVAAFGASTTAAWNWRMASS